MTLAGKMCYATSAVIVVLSLIAYLVCEIAGRYDLPVSPHELGHFKCAAVGLGMVLVLEVVTVLGIWSSPKELRYFSLGDSWFHDSQGMVFVYCVVFVVYFLMARGSLGLVHTNPFGGGRPVHTLRFAEWSLVVPVLMLVVGRAMPRKEPVDFKPALLLTFVYVWSAWLALVVTSEIWRGILIFISVVAAAVSTWDEYNWTRGVTPGDPTARSSKILLFCNVSFFGIYGVIYVLAAVDIIPPLTEQVIFAYLDGITKVGQTVVLATMRRQRDTAVLVRAKQDAAKVASDLTRLVDTANAPILSVDMAGCVVLWNLKLAALTGLSHAETQGRPLLDLVRPECREEVDHVLSACREGRETSQFHIDLAGKPADGEGDPELCVPLIMNATARRDAAGDVVGAVGVGQDMTEVTAYKAVEERKMHLMATVSHELRSPLHGIIGLLTGLEQQEKEEKRKKQLGMVKSCSTRLLDLVTNIMDMSSETKAQKPLSQDPVELPKILDEVCALAENAVDKSCRPLLRQGVALRNRVPGDLPIFEGDAYKLTQVFFNLVTNACKFCPTGSITISGHLRRDAKTIEIDIADTGTGIAPTAIKRIFEAFEQENNSDSKSYQGVGLGLAISRAVVRRHGGDISVVSTVGRGSIFTVSLPFRPVGGAGVGCRSPSPSPESEPVHRSGQLRGMPDESPRPTSANVVPLPQAAVLPPVESRELAHQALITELANLQGEIAKRDGKIQELNQQVLDLQKEAEIREQRRGALACGSAREVATDPSRNWQAIAQEGSDGQRKAVILSVDDDSVNQEVILAALADNYEVHAAMDGYECLQYFSKNSKLPDLLLLDVMMPGMSGYEVCTHLRQELGLSPALLPIIMLSARSPKKDSVIRGLSSGCNDYVMKPFDVEVVQAKCKSCLMMKRLNEVERERSRYQDLLHEIMPAHITRRLLSGENVISESHKAVTVLFSDIVGWTNIAEALPTAAIVALLNELFSAFDALTEQHGVYKVETIGDAYMVAAGHDGSVDHTEKVARFALAMLAATKSVPPPPGMQLRIRVGIHTGPAYTGVVGKKVPRYCFFGDTVNVASRMESNGLPGCIHISQHARDQLNSASLDGATIVARGGIEIKGKGHMQTHLIYPAGMLPPDLRQHNKEATDPNSPSKWRTPQPLPLPMPHPRSGGSSLRSPLQIAPATLSEAATQTSPRKPCLECQPQTPELAPAISSEAETQTSPRKPGLESGSQTDAPPSSVGAPTPRNFRRDVPRDIQVELVVKAKALSRAQGALLAMEKELDSKEAELQYALLDFSEARCRCDGATQGPDSLDGSPRWP